jgi:hypothetical protein
MESKETSDELGDLDQEMSGIQSAGYVHITCVCLCSHSLVVWTQEIRNMMTYCHFQLYNWLRSKEFENTEALVLGSASNHELGHQWI